MALKKYFLSVDLVIDGKPVTVSLAEFDLMALEKYTAFCNGPDDLLMYMPNDEPFFAKNYLSSHIKRPIAIDDDPFSIRTSKSKRAKKIKIIYKKDLDVLLAGKKALLSKMVKNYNLTINDCVNGNISKEEENALKYMYDKFAGRKFYNAVLDILERKLDVDHIYEEEYLIPKNNKWMFIALSSKCASALIEDAFKDDRKRIELAFFLKEKTGNLLPNISGSEIDALLEKLDNRISIRKASNPYIRRSIQNNLKIFNSKLNKTQEKQIKPSVITEDEIINYNKQRKMTPELNRVLYISEKVESLKLSLKTLIDEKEDLQELLKKGSFIESDESISKRLEFINQQVDKIKKQIAQLKYEMYELESGNMVYTDAEFVVEKGKDM